MKRARAYRPRASTGEPQPGLPARVETDCARCPDRIAVGDRYVFHRGRAIHVRCASGGDE